MKFDWKNVANFFFCRNRPGHCKKQLKEMSVLHKTPMRRETQMVRVLSPTQTTTSGLPARGSSPFATEENFAHHESGIS